MRVHQLALEVAPAIPEGYVAMPEAMQMLGKSQATMERHVTNRTVPMRLIPRRGQKPMRVFLASALEELRNKEQRRKAHRPPSAITPKPPALNTQITTFALDKIAAAGIAIASALDAHLHKKPIVPIAEKLWLSLEEAEELSGLARATLLKLAQSGAVTALKSGGWKLRRKSLEEFNG
jgi:predicted DNA-binding transcriptional regulator AlpA